MKIIPLLLLFATPALAGPVEPRIPTEAEKLEALQLGYIMNNFSMNRFGSIDLTDHFKQKWELIGPPSPPPALAKRKEVMTDKEWDEAIAEIGSLRYQLTHNIMPPAERDDLRCKLVLRLHALAERSGDV